jgi:hypothetical protein
MDGNNHHHHINLFFWPKGLDQVIVINVVGHLASFMPVGVHWYMLMSLLGMPFTNVGKRLLYFPMKFSLENKIN